MQLLIESGNAKPSRILENSFYFLKLRRISAGSFVWTGDTISCVAGESLRSYAGV